MVWSETINFMLLTDAKWRVFTSRPIPPKTSSGVMLALSCVAAAIQAGLAALAAGRAEAETALTPDALRSVLGYSDYEAAAAPFSL